MAEISIVGIKKLFYGPLIAAPAVAYVDGDATKGLSPAELKAFLALGTTKQVANIHGDNWSYEEGMPSVTGHKNKLTGEEYRATTEKGTKKMNFSVGKYDFETKAALQGGGASATKYAGPSGDLVQEKTWVALSEDDIYIVFPRGRVLVGGTTTDDAVALKCEVSQMEPTQAGMEPFCMFTKASVDSAT